MILLLLLIVAAASSADAQGVRLKIATMAPDGSAWLEELETAAEEIASRTDDRVRLRFYPGGTMGGDQAVLRKIRIGQLQGGLLLGGGLAQVDPNFDIYTLPLLFRSYDEVDYVRSRMDDLLIERLAGEGFVAFGVSETGFTYLLSARATRSFDDLKGSKAWTPQGDPIGLAIVTEAGLAPVPLPISDVLTGLQTGLIDTVAAPPVGALALQWFTKAPYFTDLPITYVYGGLVISAKSIAKVSAADQQILRGVLAAALERLDERSRADNRAAREALIKQGVTIVEPTAETRSKWDQIAARTRTRLIDEMGFDPDLVARAHQLLEEYREAKAGVGSGE
jgi:TRAP-type C4-dicarboxylate transport system substrate-binding protein